MGARLGACVLWGHLCVPKKCGQKNKMFTPPPSSTTIKWANDRGEGLPSSSGGTSQVFETGKLHSQILD